MKDHGEDFLVGNKFSWADIQLLEAVLTMEELDASVLSDFPLLKVEFEHPPRVQGNMDRHKDGNKICPLANLKTKFKRLF